MRGGKRLEKTGQVFFRVVECVENTRIHAQCAWNALVLHFISVVPVGFLWMPPKHTTRNRKEMVLPLENYLHRVRIVCYFCSKCTQNSLIFTLSQNAPEGEQLLSFSFGHKTCINTPSFPQR